MSATDFKVITSQLDVFKQRLNNALQSLQIEITESQQQTLLLYLDKLLFWNKAYNLTAIKQPQDALVKHLFDCLAILPHLKAGKLLDIGTGAGLPGVIIAICEPQREVTVLDSNQKKIRFIRQISCELKLDNLTPITSRIEHLTIEDSDKFEVITSRAFASLIDFVDASKPYLAQNGVLQAMKGLQPESFEVDTLSTEWQINSTPLDVPKLNETRHLVTLSRR